MSLACINSDGAGSSRVRLSEEAEVFDPEGGDEKVEVDLDDEPGSLLDFLNAWRKVAASSFWVIHGLSLHIELETARSPYFPAGPRAHLPQYDGGRSQNEDG